jgi:hypothetical protein
MIFFAFMITMIGWGHVSTTGRQENCRAEICISALGVVARFAVMSGLIETSS